MENNNFSEAKEAYSTEKNTQKKVTEIVYFRPPFWKRVSLRVFDFLICALLGLCVFIGLRGIVNNSSSGSQKIEYLNQIREESGLYIYNNELKKYEDYVTYLNKTNDQSYSAKTAILLESIDNFHDFIKTSAGEDTYNLLIEDFNTCMLSEKLVYEGAKLFVEDANGKAIKNEDAHISIKVYYEMAYVPYFDERCLAQLVNYAPHFLEYQQYFSNMMLFMEIPLSIFLSSLVIYYIIPLCFYRGKQTLGKFFFQTGLVDSNVYTVKFWRFTSYYLIFLIFEVYLSLLTFGVPLIISFSMMAFSKNKQNFHQYMLGIQEVDISCSKIYHSKEEIINPSESQYDIKNFKMR